MWETTEYFEIILVGSGLIFLISVLFIILYFHFNKKIVTKELEKNKSKLIHQKELLKNELKAIEKERKRIAQDLHDEIGANLAYIGLNLAQISEACHEKGNTKDKIKSCHEQLNKSINDVRRISHDLLPPTLEMFGLVPALREYINKIDSNFAITIDEDENFVISETDTSLQLYRVILELIGNALKHSQGNCIKLAMQIIDEKKVIRLSDNGIGYDFEEMQKKEGLGLKNIVSRLDAIDSEFHFNSLEQGTEIMIILNE